MIDPIAILNAKSNKFDYNAITAPPLFSMVPAQLDYYLYDLIIKSGYSIEKKYQVIDKTMADYGFYKLARGTNRSVYRSAFNNSIVLKIGMDKYGAEDARHEYRNQEHLKPFCAKTFEVSPSGIIGLFERVTPITHRDEFESIATDIYDMLFNIISQKFIMADVGLSFFMNYGLRLGFGPVLLDYPYLYKMDRHKLVCRRLLPDGSVCDGLIDYDAAFDFLVCEKCGKRFLATDVATKEEEYSTPFIFINSGISLLETEEDPSMSKIIRGGRVVLSSDGSIDVPTKQQQRAQESRDTFAGEPHQSYIVRKFFEIMDRFKDDSLSFSEIQNMAYIFVRTMLMSDKTFSIRDLRPMEVATNLTEMVLDRWEKQEPEVIPTPQPRPNNNGNGKRNNRNNGNGKREQQHVPWEQRQPKQAQSRPEQPKPQPAPQPTPEVPHTDNFDQPDPQPDIKVEVLGKDGKPVDYQISEDDFVNAVINNAKDEADSIKKARVRLPAQASQGALA